MGAVTALFPFDINTWYGAIAQGVVIDAGSGTMRSIIKEADAKFPDAGWRVQDRSDGAPGARRFIERLGQFLTLGDIGRRGHDHNVIGAGPLDVAHLAEADRGGLDRRAAQGLYNDEAIIAGLGRDDEGDHGAVRRDRHTVHRLQSAIGLKRRGGHGRSGGQTCHGHDQARRQDGQ